MKDYSEKIKLELTYSDLSEIVGALVFQVERMKELNCSSVMLEPYIKRAENLNHLLEKEEFNHWCKEKFSELRK